MSRLIYIRHAEKEYKNGKSKIYSHDPGITKDGLEKTKIITQKLLDLWGDPDLIVCSPYQRTRETAITINNVLRQLDKPVKIKIDPELSEYLGNHKDDPMDVRPETEVWNPPHPETFSQMKQRIKSHYRKIVNWTFDHPGKIKTIWFVTHGLIIKQISEFTGLKFHRKRTIPNLSCLSVIENNDSIKTDILIFDDEDNKSFSSSDSKSMSISESQSESYSGSHDNMKKLDGNTPTNPWFQRRI